MKSLRVKQLIYKYGEEDEILSTYTKNAFVNPDEVSSFYIEEPEMVDGEMVKPFFLGCQGIAYSVMPEPHVYREMRKRFIDNAITE